MSSASTLAEPAADAHTLLSRRNRDGALAAPQQWNEVLETILNHRSVRGFLPRALPEGTLELLIAAAQSASTSSNLQFWSVVAVQETERKSRLAELAGQQQFIRDAPLLLVWLADLSRLDRIAAERQAQVDGTHYLEEFIVGVVDAALAAQSALIAAESLGLGAVYIGAMRNLPEQIAAELALPPHVFAVFGMSIGYPDPARPTGHQAASAAIGGAASRAVLRGATQRGDRRLQRDDARVPARAGHAGDRLDAAMLQPREGRRGVARPRPDARGAAQSGVRTAVRYAVNARGDTVQQ